MSGAERLVFQPDSALALQRGINLIADAIRPTLGPVPRAVAFDLADAEKPPELLDKGGLIARRITNLPDRDEDMGAMLLRGMLWQLYDELGDGTATAALLFQSIVNAGLRAIVAGADASRLRSELNRQLEIALVALREQQARIEGAEDLAQLAHCICHDRELAERLGEIFAFIGEYGQLDVRRGHRREIAHDYMRGMYWQRGAISRAMLRGGKEPDRMVMNNCAILLSDLDIEALDEVAPLFAALMQAGAKNLLLVGNKFSEPVINFILANKKPEQFRVVAVKTPGETAQHQQAHLADMAVITGATPLYKAAGDALRGMKTARLGSAKQVWVERNLFGLVSDRDNQTELTEHLAGLLEQLDYARDKDSETFLRARVGMILGGVAILRIGDGVPARMDARIALAKETAKSLRQALRDGVVPGGGAALWTIRAALRDQPPGDSESRAARQILLAALESPLRTICHNAGYDGATVAQLEGQAPGTGIDARSGEAIDMLSAGIMDVASVVEAALRKAVSSAALALTIDVLLHHPSPPASYNP
ncbi:MAG: hypothetical protein OXE95_01545 [Chloroflexi bacterium]|nr:hypothetical protein [Chloroflexota bacterium]MCY4246244.1 hypothetical protein [Chloroflexota bacterium]